MSERPSFQRALDDCARVDDDMVFWALGKLQLKTALVEEARRHLGKP